MKEGEFMSIKYLDILTIRSKTYIKLYKYILRSDDKISRCLIHLINHERIMVEGKDNGLLHDVIAYGMMLFSKVRSAFLFFYGFTPF